MHNRRWGARPRRGARGDTPHRSLAAVGSRFDSFLGLGILAGIAGITWFFGEAKKKRQEHMDSRAAQRAEDEAAATTVKPPVNPLTKERRHADADKRADRGPI